MKNLKVQAVAVSLVVLLSNCLFAYSIETNFWKERKKSQNPVVASLPSNIFSPTSLPAINNGTLAHALHNELPARFGKIGKYTPQLLTVLKSIPSEDGSIRKIAIPSDAQSNKIVIHIQDVHLNEEAQHNIGDVVRKLIQKNQVSLVGLEGTFKLLDFSGFQTYPNREAVRKVTDYLLKINKISGPVHALMNLNSKFPEVFGVDDYRDYNSNVEAYRLSQPLQISQLDNLKKLKDKLAKKKISIFSSDLLAFDQQVERFRAGKALLPEYLGVLMAGQAKKSPNLESFVEALTMESKFDFKKVEAERTVMIQRLAAKQNPAQTASLLNFTISFRAGEITPADFYQFLQQLCQKAGLPLSNYPAMQNYVRYVLLCDKIDFEDVMAQVGNLERDGYIRRSKSPEETALIAESRSQYLVGQLLNFALTPEEWNEYKSLNSQTMRTGPKNILSGLQHFEDFYLCAERRDAKLAQNLLHQMAARDGHVAVLVTGGFHSHGIRQKLLQAGITTIEFTPKLTKIDASAGSNYLSVFTQAKTPLENFLKGEKLFLSIDPDAGEPAARMAVPAIDSASDHLSAKMTKVRFQALCPASSGASATQAGDVVTAKMAVPLKLLRGVKGLQIKIVFDRLGQIRWMKVGLWIGVPSAIFLWLRSQGFSFLVFSQISLFCIGAAFVLLFFFQFLKWLIVRPRRLILGSLISLVLLMPLAQQALSQVRSLDSLYPHPTDVFVDRRDLGAGELRARALMETLEKMDASDTKALEQTRKQIEECDFDDLSFSFRYYFLNRFEHDYRKIGKLILPVLQRRLKLQTRDAKDAAELLGIIGDRKAVPDLIEALKNNYCSEAAAAALGNIGDASAAPALVQAYLKSPYERNVIMNALEILGTGATPYLVKEYASISDPKNPASAENIKREFIWMMKESPDPLAVPTLLTALKDESDHVRETAIKALGTIGDASAKKALRKIVDDEILYQQKSWFRELASSALLEIEKASPVRTLIEKAEKDPSIRPGAIQTLAKLGDKRALSFLIKIAKGDEACRVEAIRALRGFSTPEVDTLLTELLRSQDPKIVKEAAIAVGTMKMVSAVPALVELLDGQKGAQYVAAEALGNIGATIPIPYRHPKVLWGWLDSTQEKLIIPALVSALRKEHFAGRQPIFSALEKLNWNPRDDEERALYSLCARRFDELWHFGPDATSVLVEFLNDETAKASDGEIASVIDALGSFKDLRAVPILSKFSRAEKAALRTKAQEALDRIWSDKSEKFHRVAEQVRKGFLGPNVDISNPTTNPSEAPSTEKKEGPAADTKKASAQGQIRLDDERYLSENLALKIARLSEARKDGVDAWETPLLSVVANKEKFGEQNHRLAVTSLLKIAESTQNMRTLLSLMAKDPSSATAVTELQQKLSSETLLGMTENANKASDAEAQVVCERLLEKIDKPALENWKNAHHNKGMMQTRVEIGLSVLGAIILALITLKWLRSRKISNKIIKPMILAFVLLLPFSLLKPALADVSPATQTSSVNNQNGVMDSHQAVRAEVVLARSMAVAFVQTLKGEGKDTAAQNHAVAAESVIQVLDTITLNLGANAAFHPLSLEQIRQATDETFDTDLFQNELSRDLQRLGDLHLSRSMLLAVARKVTSVAVAKKDFRIQLTELTDGDLSVLPLQDGASGSNEFNLKLGMTLIDAHVGTPNRRCVLVTGDEEMAKALEKYARDKKANAFVERGFVFHNEFILLTELNRILRRGRHYAGASRVCLFLREGIEPEAGTSRSVLESLLGRAMVQYLNEKMEIVRHQSISLLSAFESVIESGA